MSAQNFMAIHQIAVDQSTDTAVPGAVPLAWLKKMWNVKFLVPLIKLFFTCFLGNTYRKLGGGEGKWGFDFSTKGFPGYHQRGREKERRVPEEDFACRAVQNSTIPSTQLSRFGVFVKGSEGGRLREAEKSEKRLVIERYLLTVLDTAYY